VIVTGWTLRAGGGHQFEENWSPRSGIKQPR
jgi:long-subunit fatty acid transport protein